MARRRYQSTLQGYRDINITPLMDLTFLLLIVFIITRPMLEYEFDVSPPRMTADKIDEAQSIMINITVKGQIMYENSTVSLPDLTRRLAFVHETKPNTTALIRADGNRPYHEIVDLMRAVRAARIDNVALVTLPED